MALLIDFLLVAVLVAGLAFASVLLGPRDQGEGDHRLPFETGLPPLDRARGNMSVLYIRFALLFTVFDVDLAFLLPWVGAPNRSGLGPTVALTIFLGLAALLLAYVWRKGILECR